ncbi:MAG: choice-of-anchor D domain-containing protein [Syntrophales bacterium]
MPQFLAARTGPENAPRVRCNAARSGHNAWVGYCSPANSVDFGGVKVRDSGKESIKVANKGMANLTVTKVEVVGFDAAAFKPQTASFSVKPSSEYLLQVEFRPTAQRSYAATLRLHSNDPDTPIKQISLSGAGIR